MRVDKNLELPSIPVVLTRILEVMDDNSSSAKQLEAIILHDPSLSARILKLANSAFYSFESEVKTISRAIPLLGYNLVRSLAIGVSIFESFTRGNRNEAGQINRLWIHSVGVGMLAREIWLPRTDRKEGEFAMLCGLLHDMGKVVLFKRDAAHYTKLFTMQKDDPPTDMRTLEAETYGRDHAALGGALARQWGLPAQLSDVVEKHHTPLDEDVPPLAAAVAISDILTRQGNLGYDGDTRAELEIEKLLAEVRMNPEEFEVISSGMAARRKDIEQFFRFAA